MSLKIIKPGLFNTIQDGGRNGYRHLGINPNGYMDRFSAQLANALLGKELHAPLLEIHDPAPTILFEEATVICIAGADFLPCINNQPITLSEPFYVPANSILEFKQLNYGAWCYLSVLHQLHIDAWLNSHSTNIKVTMGGFEGRPLKKRDRIQFKNKIILKKSNSTQPLHWHAREAHVFLQNEISFIRGNEWNWLTSDAALLLLSEKFQVLQQSERMAYRLQGVNLTTKNFQQLVSSAVCAGTMQLLPNGQLIVLMADHQTTGGYPRIGQIITTDIGILAQQRAGNFVRFKLIDLKTAEEKMIKQHQYLQELQLACSYNMQNFLHASL